MADEKKPGIFGKLLNAADAVIDAQIAKAQNIIKESAREREEAAPSDEPEFNFGKAITKDRNYYIGTQGYYEKPAAIGLEFYRQMALKSSIVAGIIKTRQSRVSSYSKPSKGGDELGFRVVLRNEQEQLDEIKQMLLDEAKVKSETKKKVTALNPEIAAEVDAEEGMNEAEQVPDMQDMEDGDLDRDGSPIDHIEKMNDRDLTRKAKAILAHQTKARRRQLEQYIEHCGELEDRPFDTKKWNFDAFLKAISWDSWVYDQFGVEFVPKEAEMKGEITLHHFRPIDGATLKFAAPSLNMYQNSGATSAYDIMYPEEELKALESKDVFELDKKKVEDGEYVYVQVIRGKIERAFTEDELALGIRNPITDIYYMGYGLPELELLLSLVSSHLNTEYYNKSYFQQGFSAKGLLHIKANLNRSKLEEIRRHWRHLVSGSKNSFQTPIMAGMDEIQWIPLTQNHSEMEFSLWLNYLIKMICMIYQIDPAEVGYGMRDEGGKGGGLAGDGAGKKLQNSRDKGFVPYMTYLQNFMNKEVMPKLDEDYMFEWVGLESEDPTTKIANEIQEVKYKKTVNEMREESNLPPIPGADDLILDPVFFQWFSMFHPDAKKNQAEMGVDQAMQQDNQNFNDQQNKMNDQDENQLFPEEEAFQNEQNAQADHERQKELITHEAKTNKQFAPKSVKKSVPLKVEYYTIKGE